MPKLKKSWKKLRRRVSSDAEIILERRGRRLFVFVVGGRD